MFEQDQSGLSPEPAELASERAEQAEAAEAASEKKISSVVLLAAGGVLVATVCATFASMLAAGGEPEAGPPKAKAEVEADQPATTSTSLSIAPDGSTATVVVTVPGKARSDQARNVAGPADGEPSADVVVTQTVVPSSEQQTTKVPPSVPPSEPVSSAPGSSSVVPPVTSVSVPSGSGEPGKP